jgi:ELWxxDGT repeat protein
MDKRFENLGSEIWVSDGTTSGTINLLDINPGALSSDPYLLASNNNYLYFIATDPQGLGLWKTDGTTQGTIKVSSSIGTFWSNGKGVIENDILYFIPAVYSNILYRSDGTQSGTYLINLPNTTNQQGLGDLVAFGNSCFFYLNTSQGIQFWRTNGTSQGTTNLGTIFRNSILESTSQITSYMRSGLTKFGNKIIFNVNDVYYGEEFWTYDTCELHETLDSGNWSSSSTWSCGQIPTIIDEATINKGHTISLNNDIFLKKLNLWGNINYFQNGKINFR